MIVARIRGSLAALAVVFLVSVPVAVEGQSQLDTSQATEFLGNWSIAFDSPQGPAEIGIQLTDMSGKVGAVVNIAGLGEAPITDITRAGESLVLRYSLDFQGTPVNISIGLARRADAWIAQLDFADGAFSMEAPATRAN